MWMSRLLTALVLAVFVSAAAPSPVGAGSLKTSKLTIASGDQRHGFTVELALSDDEQAQGLMYRRKLAPEAGMLFPFPQAREAAFWMKNTYIPLDMLFVAADGRIVNIAQRTVPLSLAVVSSEGPVWAVLELNGGTTARLGIRAGDRVVHPIFNGAD
jgi:uncharacterized membrane protein (UPF0127 family)